MIRYVINEKKYKNTPILKNIDITIKNGESILVMGPSGAGKTTFLKCILQETNYNGSIYTDEPSYKTQYVSQESTLDSRETAFRSIYYKAKFAYPLAFDNESLSKLVLNTMKDLGIYNIRHSLIRTLSGGQKKRTQLAHALVQKYDLLIADEVDSGLDAFTSYDILSDLVNICHKDKKKLILVSHNICPDVVHLFDKILLLAPDTNRCASVVYYGSPNNLSSHFQTNSILEILKKLTPKIENGLGMNDYYIKKYKEAKCV